MNVLLTLQQQFPPMVAKLITFAYDHGFQLTLGEAERSQLQAQANAASGAGIANSLHCLRLAIDLHLFRNGVYLDKSEDYLPLGIFWESLGGSWGGRFSKPDGNHFSLSYNGVR